jgi:hypothetical protein
MIIDIGKAAAPLNLRAVDDTTGLNLTLLRTLSPNPIDLFSHFL